MNRFHVVGVGASAGGLEAFIQLLENMDINTGHAFVLVQHLDPTHGSALTTLLSRTTSMPVREIADGVKVQPDHVYVSPPKGDISIVDGVLRLHKPQHGGPLRSIDYFFESLARDQGARSIGVILSGTASDGTLGLEAIKAEGGITFAQDTSAKYDSMPRNAEAAGCVDFVLAPKDIANELTRIARHPVLQSIERAPMDATMESARPQRRLPSDEIIKKILLLLRNHTGVDFSLYKPATILRRINRRMILRKIRGLEAYLDTCRTDAAERDALYQDALISVTAFFRNPDAFQALQKTVFPEILKNRAIDDPVRVWVAGCATGQEAYSIAIALLEVMGDSTRIPIQIYATDLNESLLAKARAGFYLKNLVQDVSPERLRRFFTAEEGGYRVNKLIREMCVFAQHNIIADAPFSRIDLISCRNVLIYLDSSVQKIVLPYFHYALKPHGFLFLGASETIGAFADIFSPRDRKHRIFVKKPGPVRSANLMMPAFRQHGGKPNPGRQPAPALRQPDVQREADRISLLKYAPPSVLVNDSLEILQFRGSTGPYLEPPRGKASFNVLKMAREGLLLPIRTAINQARKENRTIRKEGIRVDQNGRSRTANVDVTPLKNLKERCFLIFFEQASGLIRKPANGDDHDEQTEVSPSPLSRREEAKEILSLRKQLAETLDYVQSLQEQYDAAHEELQASSEEVQSSNEELQSINEELETSKEELESANEELTTVNEEMANRNAELTQLTGDLNNLHMSVDAAILLLGRDLRIRRFTPPAEKIFNLLASDIGRPLNNVKCNLNFPDLEKMVAEVISTISVRGKEAQDYQGRWYSVRARPYIAPDNKIDGAVLTIIDINDLKRALSEIQSLNVELEKRVQQRTAELGASNQELEAFCYSVAHDLRRPLRSLEGFSQVIRNNLKEKLPSKELGYFERIRAAAREMAVLIDNLLDLARLTQTEMTRATVDLTRDASAILRDFKKKEPRRTVDIVVMPNLRAKGDPKLLHIALLNLLQNAWKFTGKRTHARIEVGAIEKDREKAFFVRDNGAGFDMAYVDKLFKTFQRLHTAEEFPGTGIGLTIVQRIIQRHGGRIWAEGAVNRGATFYFSLPESSAISKNRRVAATPK